MSEYVSQDMRKRLAEAWFDGYSKGNLDGYFGTHEERDASPYADLDPYGETKAACGDEGPHEATSPCVKSSLHGGQHRDDAGGMWPR